MGADFKIEDMPPGLEPPKPKQRYRYPWADLPVGKTFYCEPKFGQTREQLIAQVKSAAFNYRRSHDPDKKGKNSIKVEIYLEGPVGIRVKRVG
jgi:hypothetical protein